MSSQYPATIPVPRTVDPLAREKALAARIRLVAAKLASGRMSADEVEYLAILFPDLGEVS